MNSVCLQAVSEKYAKNLVGEKPYVLNGRRFHIGNKRKEKRRHKTRASGPKSMHEKWQHDRYIESLQRPKTTRVIIAAYGHDIRQEVNFLGSSLNLQFELAECYYRIHFVPL